MAEAGPRGKRINYRSAQARKGRVKERKLSGRSFKEGLREHPASLLRSEIKVSVESLQSSKLNSIFIQTLLY